MKNNLQQSVRVKVGRIITAFSLFMVVFYTYMLLQLKDSGLRDATHSVLLHEAQLFVEAYSDNPVTPLPDSYSLRGYIGNNALPADITYAFPTDAPETWHKRKSGVFYRLTADDKAITHHHLYIQDLPNSDDDLYLYYGLSTDKDEHIDIWKNVKQVALLGFVLVILMLLVLRNFIHRALNPISSLSQWITGLDDEKRPSPLPDDISDDEIGQLANNLFSALERIHAHNEREQSFLRNASHELRTPIAIIRNTMDVIEHHNARQGNPEIERLLKRIRRASDTMKAVTEAILWLAIDTYSAPEKTETDLESLMKEVIEENKNLLDSKNITVSQELHQLTPLQAEKALVHIAFDNLIRNAFQHCSGGNIHVVAHGAHTIKVSNSRYNNYIDSEQNDHALSTGGFGLGLALVQKIAEKNHWRFEFSLENDHATATLQL